MRYVKRLLAGSLIMSVVAAGCSVTAGLDTAKVEQSIRTEIASQVGVTFASVECPESHPIQAGGVFSCTAMVEGGGPATVEVTQSDAAGNVNIRLRTLISEAVEAQLIEQLSPVLGTQIASAECPENRPMLTGDTFDCTAVVEDGTQLTVAVTQQDDNGSIQFEVTGQQ